MTFLTNRPQEFVAEATAGLCRAFPDVVRQIPGGVMRSTRRKDGKVGVVVGGGSGHYPAFAGMVGYGLADAAVMGDIFASPSAQQAQAVCAAADLGSGVLLLFGNYAGDVLNFGAAALRLKELGRDVRCLTVTDDIVSDAVPAKRRGIAGDLFVFKIAGAAAEEGYDLDATERVSLHANDRVRSFGVAFGGCTLPGAPKPLFTVPAGEVALGLGVHGEPGVGALPLPTAEELAKQLVDRILEDRPVEGSARVAAVLNGLGAVKYEELFVLWNTVGQLLDAGGLEVVVADVGEFVTSLDMAGCSLTVAWLDDELERLWLAPAHATGFRRGNVPQLEPDFREVAEVARLRVSAAPSETGRQAGRRVAEAFAAIDATLAQHSGALGDLDAVAGDGDHGLGMSRGSSAAHAAADEAADMGAGPRDVLRAAADAWADRAGGASGALWGAGLQAIAYALPVDDAITPQALASGFEAALEQITALGGAKPGDKTLVDALGPFAATLAERIEAGAPLPIAWDEAVTRADDAARATADITARVGRSRVLGERSLGTPDPGATSLVLCLRSLASALCPATDAGGDSR
jgi:D-erythrulose 4-kinase